VSGLIGWWQGFTSGLIEWLRGLSSSDRLALVGIVVTVVVAIVGPLRRALLGLLKATLKRTGRDERHYAEWFIRQWGVYDNPYLDDKEDLDLDNTYISLSLCPPDSDQETRTAAGYVLADRAGGNLVIEGDPGSGKSTLLKAYGVGALKSRRGLMSLRRGPRDDQIPFFVQLRKLAQHLGAGHGLAEYLIDQVLVSGAGMAREIATQFLRSALTDGRALVMLDGLDEVTADRQTAVLDVAYAFINNQSPDLPTHQARVVVTCRRQNFIALRDQWVPAIAETVSTLVPLRNSEIFAYLNKLRSKFKATGGPETFMNAVRASGTLDLHRTPLILAMSVGLYARKDFYEIPNSIAKLYRTMIREMLDRQRHKRDPGGASIVLKVDDKYDFLREFALSRARSDGGFDDFTRDDMDDFAKRLAPSLRDIPDPRVLVAEVADRSGLVNDVSEAGHYVFAHRSLHEHLVAEELLALPDGETTLLDRATDPEWRQVVLFFAAALEQRRADVFLPALATRSVTLAGHCLAGSVPSDHVAEPILDGLLIDDTAHLTALVATTTSPRRSVQEMAVTRLENQLNVSMHTVRRAFKGDVEGMLPLLGALAGSNAARIAALVPQIVAGVPDDPRLVEPLWRCLIVAGIEKDPACRAIVERLLVIAMDGDGFEALQRQEPYTRGFLDRVLRRRAYPFEKGLPATCNLVTLLAWAEYLNVIPLVQNQYFKAKVAERLDRVEVDKRRTIGISLFWPARIVSILAAVVSVAALVAVLVADWRLVLQPLGWWTPLVSLALGAIDLLALIVLAALSDRAPEGSFIERYLDAIQGEQTAHLLLVVEGLANEDVALILAVAVAPISYALAVPPLVAGSLWTYFLAAAVVPFFIFWLPALDLFDHGVRFYPYRPNAFVDVYEDPRSRLWLGRVIGDEPYGDRAR
jgi:hypothetical protein